MPSRGRWAPAATLAWQPTWLLPAALPLCAPSSPAGEDYPCLGRILLYQIGSEAVDQRGGRISRKWKADLVAARDTASAVTRCVWVWVWFSRAGLGSMPLQPAAAGHHWSALAGPGAQPPVW